MGDSELQSCPFCGGTAYIMTVEISSDYADFCEAYIVACKTALCRGGYSNCWYYTHEEAIEAWNRRASPWEKIKDPPRDGTTIIAQFPDGLMTRSYYDSHNSIWMTENIVMFRREDPLQWMEIPK